MDEFIEDEAEKPSIDLMGIFYEHTCGAQDERDCSIMKHLILAEIHKSNAPAWVAEELEKKLYCLGCWNAIARRSSAVYFGSMIQDRVSANPRSSGPKSTGNRSIPARA
ncbi:MAG: hypothetical protein NTU95_01535 [Methanothrix sp.]|nr:hypothetical protein [Methanothrix sp.]